MLKDLYDTLGNQDNGLGAFYWEPGWITVKAGWNNWEYNKEIADKYGTGWASKGALGYFPDSKMYYNGNPAWGGSSWDNQALFDINGHALQSLKFYKNSQSKKGDQKTVVVRLLNKDNQEIGTNYIAKIEVGNKVSLNLPEIDGYDTPKCKVKLVSSDEDAVIINATYTKSKAISISSATVSNIKDKSYTGKAHTQGMVVRVNGKTLVKDKDYTVKYSNNKEVGTATVTITGKDKYTGTIKKQFKINIAKLSAYTIDEMKYKVTNAKIDGTGTVELVSIPTNSKKDTITVPSTIKVSGKTFKVSSIGSKAFRKNTYVKKAVLGKYITNIGQESFYGCNQLKTIEINSTNLKNVGKNAVAKIYKKATIKAPSSKLKTYKNLFKKSTGWQSGYTLKK